jgi:uncharacterized protein YcfL
MKSLFVLFLSIFVSAVAFSANDEAIAYNDKIIHEQKLIMDKILVFSSSPDATSLSDIKKQALKSIAVLKKMKPLEKNSDLLDSATDLFKFYADVTEDEYQKILDYMNQITDANRQQIVVKINEQIASITAKEKPLDEQFQLAQQEFARRHGFRLVENEMQEKIDELSKPAK